MKTKRENSLNTKKESFLQMVVTKYSKLFGKEMTLKGFVKQLQNKKSRLKKKTEKQKTGNERIELFLRNKILFDGMNGDSNP